MKKSQMCFPLSMISLLCLIATGMVFLLLIPNANSWNVDDYYDIAGIAAAASAVFGIFSLIRGIQERKAPSTLRTTGLLISIGCVLLGGLIAFNCFK